jgi:hypothetical protein
MVTATTSSTSTAPPSFTCMAASMAWVSNGFRFFSPPRSIRLVLGSILFSTAASGTSFTRTQIFKGSPSVDPAEPAARLRSRPGARLYGEPAGLYRPVD